MVSFGWFPFGFPENQPKGGTYKDIPSWTITWKRWIFSSHGKWLNPGPWVGGRSFSTALEKQPGRVHDFLSEFPSAGRLEDGSFAQAAHDKYALHIGHSEGCVCVCAHKILLWCGRQHLKRTNQYLSWSLFWQAQWRGDSQFGRSCSSECLLSVCFMAGHRKLLASLLGFWVHASFSFPA